MILLTEILRITQRDFTNIYTLHIEIQKSANGLPPSLTKKLFKVNSTVLYSLKKQIELYSENSKIIMYRSDTITLNRSKYVVNSPKTKRKAEIIAFISEIDKISKPDSDFYPKFIYNMLVSSEKANMIFNNLIYMLSNGFLLQKTACCGPQTLKKYALIQDIFQCSFSMDNLLIIVTFD